MTNENVKKVLHDLKAQLQQLESKQLHENCAAIKQEIDLIESNNEVAYLEFKFDIKGLKKCGFFDKTNDNSKHIERVCTFYGYKSIFEYSKQVTGVHLST